MSVPITFDWNKSSKSFVSKTFTHLVKDVAPSFFSRNGHIFDEETVATAEATAVLLHLQKKEKLPPLASPEQASEDAERLFRRRLRWRIQKLADRWRKTASLSHLDEEGYEVTDKHAQHQPERMAVLTDTLQRVERVLLADRWSQKEIDLFFDYKLELLDLPAYASALGISTNAAKKRASRASLKLQERLGNVAESLLVVIIWLLKRLRAARHDIMFRHV